MKRLALLLATAALLAAACGDSETDEASAEANASAATNTDEASDEESPDASSEGTDDESAEGADSEDSTEAATFGEPDWSQLEEHNLPVMGGMTLGIAAPQSIHYDANLVMVRSTYDSVQGAAQPTMVFGLFSQFVDTSPIADIAALTEQRIAAFGTAEPTGETLSAFGLEMERWSFVASDPDLDNGPLLSPYPLGTGGPTGWNPFPFSELYLAETEAGILAFGWSAPTAAELADAEAIFDQVAPSIELANQDIAARGTVTAPISASNPPESPPAPVDLPEGWDTPFDGVGMEIDPGSYTSTNLGTPVMFTVGDNWEVQPNFPGWLVLTGPESVGPGDRDLVFRTGVTELVPVNAQYERDGDAIELTDLQALADDPPPNMVIGISEIEIDGRTVLQADIEIVPSASCGETEVCEYILFTRYPFPGQSIRTGFVNRIVQIEEGLAEPLTLIVAAQDPAWFDIAQSVIDSLEFESIE